jgi:hypothetical protein
MKITTYQYEFSHNRKPRGYGLWAFSFEADGKKSEPFFYTGKYSEAKNRAVKYAVSVLRLDNPIINVLP